MPIRALLRYLLNNEEVVQKLADSYPIRRAAQLTAHLFHRSKEVGQDRMEKFRESDVLNKFQDDMKDSGKKFTNFRDVFTKELKDGFKEIKDDMKKKRE